MIACIDKHNLNKGVLWRRALEYSGGEWLPVGDAYEQNVFAYYVSLSCNHCENPVCAEACPTQAMHKGLVERHRLRWIRTVVWGAATANGTVPTARRSLTPSARRHDQMRLLPRLSRARPAPSCVAACPCRALDYGEYDELLKRYGEQAAIAPLPGPELTPSPLHLCSQPSFQTARQR